MGIGAQKCGTTSLVQYLLSHPDIFIPAGPRINSKEINFFLHDYLYEKGLSYYENFFTDGSGATAVGEISADYLYHPICRKRIRKHFDKLKFIIILRNPIERAYSNYWMECSRGNETRPFKEAIGREIGRIKNGLFEKDTFSYLQRGLYYSQIIRYMETFPRISIYDHIDRRFKT